MSTDSKELENVMRRIQKLLAIATDDRANPNEAASAAAMAEKIMRKYQLEHTDIIMASLKAGEDLSTEDVVANAKTNGTKALAVPPWVNSLGVQVSKLTEVGVRLAYTKNNEACIRFYGFISDVQLASWTLNYLVSTTLRLCKEFKESPLYIDRRSLHDYRQGVVIGIGKAIASHIEAKKAEAASATGTSLVIVKNQVISEKWGNSVFNTGTRKISVGNHSSLDQGITDGKNVNISGRILTGGSNSTLAIGVK
jgi:hypothetical protein